MTTYNTKNRRIQGGELWVVGDTLKVLDDGVLGFGSGTADETKGSVDVSIVWDGTNLIFDTAADDKLIEFGDAAATQLSFDMKWYGNAAAGASYLYFDASADLIYTTGVDLQFKDNDLLVFGTGAGATGDAQIKWDGTNLIITTTADDKLIEIGDAAATQLSWDLKWYANENAGASYLYGDASENLIYTTGVDLQFKDSDYLVFGTGAGGTGDVQITWDATNLVISATADDSVIEIGDAGATQKSFDVKTYGNTSASYMLWDASDGALELTGGANITHAIGGNVLMASRNTMAYTDTSAKTLFTIPANADIVDIVVDVTTGFNGGGTDLLDIGTSASATAYKDDLDVSSTGQTVTGWSGLGDVGASDVIVKAIYADQNTDSSAGAATITFLWTIA